MQGSCAVEQEISGHLGQVEGEYSPNCLLTFSYTKWHSDDTISAWSSIETADVVGEVI